MGQRLGTVEIWVGDQRLAVHPWAQSFGQPFILPGQVPVGDVRRRSLGMYEPVAGGGDDTDRSP